MGELGASVESTEDLVKKLKEWQNRNPGIAKRGAEPKHPPAAHEDAAGPVAAEDARRGGGAVVVGDAPADIENMNAEDLEALLLGGDAAAAAPAVPVAPAASEPAPGRDAVAKTQSGLNVEELEAMLGYGSEDGSGPAGAGTVPPAGSSTTEPTPAPPASTLDQLGGGRPTAAPPSQTSGVPGGDVLLTEGEEKLFGELMNGP